MVHPPGKLLLVVSYVAAAISIVALGLWSGHQYGPIIVAPSAPGLIGNIFSNPNDETFQFRNATARLKYRGIRTRHLTPRITPSSGFPDSYQTFIDKGKRLLELLEADISCVEQSIWTDYDELAQYGWQSGSTEKTPSFGPQSSVPIEDALAGERHLPGLTEADANGPWRLPHERHVKASTHNDPAGDSQPRTFPLTGGYYQTLFNTQGTVLIAVDNLSPAEAGLKREPPVRGDDIVPLRQWSDVVFLEFKNLFQNRGYGNLQYIFQVNIINQDSMDAIDEAIDNAVGLTRLDLWPGTYLATNTDPGAAVLGSPNGFGVAWFLIQHKQELRGRTIAGVTVFETEVPSQDEDESWDWAPYYNMVFHVVEPTDRQAEPPAGRKRGLYEMFSGLWYS